MPALESIFPMSRSWDCAVDDVANVPVDAVSIRLVSGSKNVARLPSYTKLKSLWCCDTGADALDTICSCTALESLYIDNIKTGDVSALRRLTEIKVLGLEKLVIANFYSMSEFAWLAQRLQSTECPWFRPYVEISSLACKKCGAASMVMLTGKGATLTCKACDGPKCDKQIREWTDASNEVT